MSLSNFIKKVNNVANKVQKFNAKVATVDRALKSIGRATGTTRNKPRAPAKRPGK